MEKDPRQPSGCYRAYEGLKSTNNGNTSSLKRPAAGGGGMHHHQNKQPQHPHQHEPPSAQSSQVRCLCFGGVPDKASRHSFLKGFLINLAICAILVLYTLLGSFIFLYIEGSSDSPPPLHQRGVTHHVTARNNATWLNQINEARVHTVENLWNTTVKLNILYHENWTRLASEEIARFQDQLVRTLTDNLMAGSITHTGSADVTGQKIVHYEWNFARAFLYSLTVLTTIGYGSIAPRSTLGKVVTMSYAFVGIPLTLIYLSSAGGLLSRCARGVFTRALCCCLCSNCGYCCYDERRMQEKERRMRKRRQQEELAQQQQQHHHQQHQQQLGGLQEPFYVRANANATYSNSLDVKTSPKDEVSSLSSGDRPNVTILAPISICLGAMLCYIVAGAFTLHKLEGWDVIDASYFCFMSLSTIGFGDMVPGSYPSFSAVEARNATVWFCSCYIMSGMALTAMCFNILHDEIVHRLSHQQQQQQQQHHHQHSSHQQHQHHHQSAEKQEPRPPPVDELSAEPFAINSS